MGVFLRGRREGDEGRGPTYKDREEKGRGLLLRGTRGEGGESGRKGRGREFRSPESGKVKQTLYTPSVATARV